MTVEAFRDLRPFLLGAKNGVRITGGSDVCLSGYSSIVVNTGITSQDLHHLKDTCIKCLYVQKLP